MRKCPGCKNPSNTFTVYGPLVYGTVSVMLDDNDMVEIVGPCVAQTIIKKGKELSAKGAKMTCPVCGYTDIEKMFLRVYICGLTGDILEEAESMFISGVRIARKYEQDARVVLEETIAVNQNDAVYALCSVLRKKETRRKDK